MQQYRLCKTKGTDQISFNTFRGANENAHKPSYRACCVCSVYTVSFLMYVWFMLGEYCPLSLMHANPLTLAVCGSRFKNRGGAARRGGAGGLGVVVQSKGW